MDCHLASIVSCWQRFNGLIGNYDEHCGLLNCNYCINLFLVLFLLVEQSMRSMSFYYATKKSKKFLYACFVIELKHFILGFLKRIIFLSF